MRIRHTLSRVRCFFLFTLCAPVVAQTPVYIDFVYPGVETGAALQPYDTLAEGIAGVAIGGEVRVLSNNSHEAFTVTKALTLTAQSGPVRIGTTTSPLGSGAPLKWLRIVELMYHPADGGAEYLELVNTGPVALDVSGVQFTLGITYTFPSSTVLSPGEYRVLVRSTDAAVFTANYPSVPVGGYYTGALDNAGETLQLSTAGAVPFLTLTYNDAADWPTIADGEGFSLVILNAQGDPNDPVNWRGSTELGGSPGIGESNPNNPTVVINEALTHTDLPQVDQVELRNLSNVPADVRGWFITDNASTPQKARIPNTVQFIIPAGGYAVLTEANFAPPPSGSPGSVGATQLPGFRMSAFGDEGIYLFSADSNGVLTGYMHGFLFGGSQNGVSFGRWVTSEGREHFVPMTSTSWGMANSSPRIGPLVISEVHYSPFPGGIEYVEITNSGGTTVNLYDTTVGGNPANTYRIGGIGFAFPPGQSLAAGAKALIVNGPPTHYTAQFGAQGMTVYGPFGNYDGADAFALSNGDETLRILWPDEPGLNPETGQTEAAYITMDTVRYDNDPPWPNAANNFMSLRRTNSGTFGSEPLNWTAQATVHQPTGGVVAPVTMSLPRGFYTGTQSLTLSTTTPGATIYYTTDGSLPAPSFGASTQYTGAISMPANRAIRASAYRTGWIRSPITSASYLINTPANQRGAKALAIIAAPQEDLFAPRGIMGISGGTYVPDEGNLLKWTPNLPNTSQPILDNPAIGGFQNWINDLGNPVYPPGGAADPAAFNNALLSGRFIERRVSFEWLDPLNTPGNLQLNAGIRLHGSDYHRIHYVMNPSANWTLLPTTASPDFYTAAFTKFSFRMYFREDYGTSKLTWPIFPGDPLPPSYDAVVLRGGHNDGYNPFIRDEFTRRLYADLGHPSVRGDLYGLFVNGVYRGYYNATERIDTDFLATRFNASNNWDIVEQSLDTVDDPNTVVADEGDLVAWNELMVAVALNLNNTANYNAVAAMLDMNSFIDYLLVELYAGNIDWPNNNFCLARERVPGAKWQFLVWDAELTYLSAFLNQTGINSFPFFAEEGLKESDDPISYLYRRLVTNSAFRTLFSARAVAAFGSGGALDVPNLSARYNELKAEMVPILPAGVTFDNFDYIGNTWIPNREAVVTSALRNEGLYP